MSKECTHECSSCSSDCSERTKEQTDFREKSHELSNIKNVIAVVSGKGGVGKSMVTSLMAAHMKREGYKTAILDADVTGPSIPRMFGLKEKAAARDEAMLPVKTVGGIPVMSVNLILENDTDPVIWRGPLIAGMVKQLWTDVIWGDIDYMFIDMPPGTGDVPLTVFQSLPVNGIIVVTSPQELVGMIVEKAVKMAEMMNIPVLGIVENMSFFRCSDCGSRHNIFGESRTDETGKRFGIKTISRIPIDPQMASAADNGKIEVLRIDELDEMIKMLIEKDENQ